jgi:hypothetical protein
MATFPLALANLELHAKNAKLIASLSIETGKPLARPTTVAFAPDPMDVRGIPAVGRNCPGRINGTRPDAVCDR